MSYCRFGENSDCYVYDDGEDYVCAHCSIDEENERYPTLVALEKHLLKHRELGHNVPGYTIDRIRMEMATKETIFGREIPEERIGI